MSLTYGCAASTGNSRTVALPALFVAKLSWSLTALDVSLTFVKQLHARATKFLKIWLGLPQSVNTAIIVIVWSRWADLRASSLVMLGNNCKLFAWTFSSTADLGCSCLYDSLAERQGDWSRKFPPAVEHACAATVVDTGHVMGSDVVPSSRSLRPS